MRPRSRLALALLLVLALVLAAPVDGKKKKGGGGSRPMAVSSGVINASVPDALNVAPFTDGLATSTINVAGKRFRGLKIEDVNVAIRATLSPIGDLTMRLIAPNGAVMFPASFPNSDALGTGSPDCSGTFMTLDDETRDHLGSNPTTDPDVDELPPPYAGRAHPGGRPLAVFDGGPVAGQWTLGMRDHDSGGANNVIHCWQLEITARRPQKGRSR